MKVGRSFLAMAFGLVAIAAVPASTRAGLFTRTECAPSTRQTRCEWESELRNSKRFEGMSCAEISCYAEAYRMRINQQILATAFRPVAESAPRPAPPTTSTPSQPEPAADNQPQPLPRSEPASSAR